MIFVFRQDNDEEVRKTRKDQIDDEHWFFFEEEEDFIFANTFSNVESKNEWMNEWINEYRFQLCFSSWIAGTVVVLLSLPWLVFFFDLLRIEIFRFNKNGTSIDWLYDQ